MVHYYVMLTIFLSFSIHFNSFSDSFFVHQGFNPSSTSSSFKKFVFSTVSAHYLISFLHTVLLDLRLSTTSRLSKFVFRSKNNNIDRRQSV
jgi:hypothetical protein